MVKLSDRELITQYITTGDKQYFAQIYIRYRQLVFQKCLFYTGDTDDAEDFVQDIFVHMTRKIYSYKGEAKFTTWLHSVTVNYCIDQLRKQRQTQTLCRNYQQDSSQMTDWASASDEVYFQAFEQVLNQLPQYQRDLLLTKYREGSAIKEIACSQDITTSAVKMRIKRAREYARLLYDKILAEKEY